MASEIEDAIAAIEQCIRTTASELDLVEQIEDGLEALRGSYRREKGSFETADLKRLWFAGYIKTLMPGVKVVGVEPYEADAMYRSLEAGKRVHLERVGLFVDGVAVRQVGAHTFEWAERAVDAVVRVTNDEICAAIKDVFDETRSVMEPAGALSVAGLKAWADREDGGGRRLVAILSGANMNFDRLRFVAERAECQQ